MKKVVNAISFGIEKLNSVKIKLGLPQQCSRQGTRKHGG